MNEVKIETVPLFKLFCSQCGKPCCVGEPLIRPNFLYCLDCVSKIEWFNLPENRNAFFAEDGPRC